MLQSLQGRELLRQLVCIASTVGEVIEPAPATAEATASSLEATSTARAGSLRKIKVCPTISGNVATFATSVTNLVKVWVCSSAPVALWATMALAAHEIEQGHLDIRR